MYNLYISSVCRNAAPALNWHFCFAPAPSAGQCCIRD
jgi:hypothetical protein